MEPALRNLVRLRAENRCEYCQIRQEDEPYYRFHIEHIIPRQHGGMDSIDNLALACHWCNLHKGPNLSGIDPETSTVITLFHPRIQRWLDHFITRESEIVGLTDTGLATVRVLQINAVPRLELRALIRAFERGNP